MSDNQIIGTKEFWEYFIKLADVLEKQTTGDDQTTWVAPNGETGKSFLGYVKELFENGGVPSTPFKTRADMQASGLPDGTYAVVTDDASLANNGLYFKQSGVWIKSKYDFNSFLGDSYKKHGLARITGSNVNSINYITATKTLELNNYVYVVNGSARYLVTTPDTVPFEGTGLFKILFDTTTLKLSTARHNTPTVEGLLHCGFAYISNTGIRTYDLLTYQVDGAIFSGGISREGQTYVLSNSGINIDTSNNVLKVANGLVRLIHNSVAYVLKEGDIPLPTSTGVYALCFDASDESVSIRPASGSNLDNIVRFGRLVYDSNGYTIYGVDRYSVNGVSIDAPEELPVNKQRLPVGKLMPIANDNIVVDSSAQTITISGSTSRLIYDRNSILLPETVIDYSTVTPPNGWAVLSYRKDSQVIVATSTTQPLGKDYVRFAFVSQRTGMLVNIPWYTLDGQVVQDGGSTGSTGSSTPINKKEIHIPYGAFSKYWRPDEELTPLKDVVESVNRNVTAFYALYDDLMATYPDYITSKDLGLDSDGNTIKQYNFSPPTVLREREGEIARPKIIIFAGIHGEEQTSMFNTYNCLKLICDNWRTDDALAELRWGVDFVVVPCAVPCGFINSTRRNVNGVDVARNFSAGWRANPDPESNTYSGVAPLSEPEAVILDNVLAENSDAICFLSHHNFAMSSPATGSFIWVPAATYFGANLGKSLVTSVTSSAYRRYEWLEGKLRDWIGYSEYFEVAGNEARQAIVKYGIQGSTFEINQVIPEQEPYMAFNKEVTTLGAESLINWFILNLRHAPDFYNSLNR